MFSFFRKRRNPPIEQTLLGAAELTDTALADSVLRTFRDQSPVVGALFLVAWENLPVYFPSFYKAMEEDKLFPATYEGMSSFHASEHSEHHSSSDEDEVAKRRHFYMYVACLLTVAHRRAAKSEKLWDDIADIWLALVPGARALRATLDRTVLWRKEHVDFFDHVRTEDEGERFLLRILMPSNLRSHPKLIAWEERDLTPEDRALIEESMQLLRGNSEANDPR
jgi:hypothetical protein